MGERVHIWRLKGLVAAQAILVTDFYTSFRLHLIHQQLLSAAWLGFLNRRSDSPAEESGNTRAADMKYVFYWNILFYGPAVCWCSRARSLWQIHFAFSSTLHLLLCKWASRTGQNSSTAMWKTHWHLSQTLDCCSCWQGCHSQLLGLWDYYSFYMEPDRFVFLNK